MLAKTGMDPVAQELEIAKEPQSVVFLGDRSTNVWIWILVSARQAVEARIGDVCGFDMTGINRYRWLPAYAAGVPLAESMYVPLSEPVEAWHFSMLNPPLESESKTLDLAFTRDGRFNAVVFWYELRLIDDIVINTGPDGLAAGHHPYPRFGPLFPTHHLLDAQDHAKASAVGVPMAGPLLQSNAHAMV
jgi:hypothetical protein